MLHVCTIQASLVAEMGGRFSAAHRSLAVAALGARSVARERDRPAGTNRFSGRFENLGHGDIVLQRIEAGGLESTAGDAGQARNGIPLLRRKLRERARLLGGWARQPPFLTGAARAPSITHVAASLPAPAAGP